MTNFQAWFTKKRVLNLIGAIAGLATVVVYILPPHVFNYGFAGFTLVALGAAKVSDYITIRQHGKTT